MRVIDLALDELARAAFHDRHAVGFEPRGVGDERCAHGDERRGARSRWPVRSAFRWKPRSPDSATATVSAMRMQVTMLPTGATIINDAYNANPTSMAAALDALAAMQATRRIAVLGLMAELDDPVVAHREIAALVAKAGIELIAVGTDRYGVAPSADPIGDLGDLGPGDVVLVKASRAAGLDRIADALSTFAS